MSQKMGKSRKEVEKAKGSTKLFLFPFICGLIAVIIGASLIFRSMATKPLVVYSATRPCHAYDKNDELAAWVNVTLTTNASVPQCNAPVNVTLIVKGIYVPPGNWTYAILEGATASFPNKEPSDWNHEPKKVIVLINSIDNPFTYSGSRIMNYTSEGDWNIILHVTWDTFFIIDCIPPNPTNVFMEIYTIPNAVHIARAESITQIKALEDSEKAGSFWSGAGFVLVGLAFFADAIFQHEETCRRGQKVNKT
jgi:hypothetical protein